MVDDLRAHYEIDITDFLTPECVKNARKNEEKSVPAMTHIRERRKSQDESGSSRSLSSEPTSIDEQITTSKRINSVPEEIELSLINEDPETVSFLSADDRGDEGKTNSVEDQEARHITLNRNLRTRTICLVALIATYSVSIPNLSYGAYILHQSIVSPQAMTYRGYVPSSDVTVAGSDLLKHLLPLSLNIGVAALTEGLGLIHATTIRWNLHREGRLQFNSNLRMLTHCSHSISNTWMCNVLNAIFLIASYASTSLVFLIGPTVMMASQTQEVNLIPNINNLSQRIHVSGLAIVTLGLGLLGQALLATLAFCSTTVPTWSSSPFDTALASHLEGAEKSNSNTMLSVGDTPSSIPSYPLSIQKSPYIAHAEVRRVLWFLWAIFIFGVLWTVSLVAGIWIRSNNTGCSYCGSYRGTGWWPIPDVGGLSPYALVTFNVNSPDPIQIPCLLIIFLCQAEITLGLHCAELLINVSRDEDIWRTAPSAAGGYNVDYNSILTAATSWKTVVLFLLKPFIHWLYGLGISYVWGVGLVMRPAQMMYMVLSFLLLALFGTYIARSRPKGTQPVAYGHIHTMINLVDEWHDWKRDDNEKLYWGHKSEDSRTKICSAGTSTVALPTVVKGKKYL